MEIVGGITKSESRANLQARLALGEGTEHLLLTFLQEYVMLIAINNTKNENKF